MIIKKPRLLHLDELIKWVWQQEIQLGRYYSNNGSYVDFEDFDVVKTHQVDKIDLFPITDEIEVTTDTIIYHFLEKDKYNNYREHWNTRISDLLFLNTTTHIWLINDDHSHTLIWENGKLYNEYEVRRINNVEYAKVKSPKPIPVPDPKPIPEPEPEPDPTPEPPPDDPLLKYKKIGVIGDSVAKGSLSSRTFGQYLAERTRGTLQNEGVSSATMATVKDNNILVQAEKVKDKDLVIIQGTDDDWLYNASEGVDIGSIGGATTTYIGAFDKIVKTIQSNNPKAKIIVLPPTRQQPVDSEGNVRRKDTDKNKKGLALVDYVNPQVSACKVLKLDYYDAYHTELFKPYDEEFRKKYMTDGLHPNAQGHYLIYKELVKLLGGN